MSNKDGKCLLCDKETDVIYNIGFTAVRVCESCANAITLQQVIDLVRKNTKE